MLELNYFIVVCSISTVHQVVLNCLSLGVGVRSHVMLSSRLMSEFQYRFATASRYPFVFGCIVIALFHVHESIVKLYHDV